MKKFIKSLIGVATLCAVTLQLQAATVSISVANGTMVNILPTSGTAKISQLIVSCDNTHAGSFQIYDCITNITAYTNPAYISATSYGTNWITTWTNYYGSTNSITNIAIVDISVTNAAASNSYPLRVTSAIPTNGVIKYDNIGTFIMGPWITNSSAATLTVTATYQ